MGASLRRNNKDLSTFLWDFFNKQMQVVRTTFNVDGFVPSKNDKNKTENNKCITWWYNLLFFLNSQLLFFRPALVDGTGGQM